MAVKISLFVFGIWKIFHVWWRLGSIIQTFTAWFIWEITHLQAAVVIIVLEYGMQIMRKSANIFWIIIKENTQKFRILSSQLYWVKIKTKMKTSQIDKRNTQNKIKQRLLSHAFCVFVFSFRLISNYFISNALIYD